MAKKELLHLCLEEYKKNENNPNVYYIFKWIEKNPNETYEKYKEMEKELYNNDWLELF